ncbi:MAG: RsmE family RNA methyltransferase [Acidobacteriota bacterium]
MLPRFFVPDLDPDGGPIALPPDEARHLTRVLRLSAGDEVAVFDGRGHEFRARVVSATRDRVQLDRLAPIAPAPESRVPLTLVQAVLKGDKMDAVVRDATMMGVTAIEPVITARTIGRLQALESGRASERWRRVAVASAKQCRRATVPAIADGRSFADWLPAGGAGTRVILVEPSAGGGDEPSLRFLETHAPASLSLLVGPEGGWSPEERQQAEAAGCLAVTLGGITLRADAVAVAAIAIVRFVLRDL